MGGLCPSKENTSEVRIPDINDNQNSQLNNDSNSDSNDNEGMVNRYSVYVKKPKKDKTVAKVEL